MKNDVINLLVVDDNQDICEVVCSALLKHQDINICGVCNNGKDALESIYNFQPDVVLLDIVMPRMDGLDVLKELRENPPRKYPKVIVSSSMGQESITKKAISLGACYYMIKPFNVTYLADKIKEMILLPAMRTKPYDDDFNLCIRKALLDVGTPTHMIGYKYLLVAIAMLMQESSGNSLYNDIYPEIAQNYETTPQCVEGAIRNVIERASKVCNKQYALIFSDFVEQKKRPSNRIFLTRIVEKIKMNNR